MKLPICAPFRSDEYEERHLERRIVVARGNVVTQRGSHRRLGGRADHHRRIPGRRDLSYRTLVYAAGLHRFAGDVSADEEGRVTVFV